MADEALSTAIAALLTVGVLLLNIGKGLIEQGQFVNGWITIGVGIACIVVAVVLIKLLAGKVAETKFIQLTYESKVGG